MQTTQGTYRRNRWFLIPAPFYQFNAHNYNGNVVHAADPGLNNTNDFNDCNEQTNENVNDSLVDTVEILMPSASENTTNVSDFEFEGSSSVSNNENSSRNRIRRRPLWWADYETDF